MKKLFNIGSSIVIDGFSELRITGPYELLTLGSHSAKIKSGSFVIEVSGEVLIVEKLAEEMAIFSFEQMNRLHVTGNVTEETIYGT